MANFFSYLSWFQIVLLMVGLMSGILSIVREALLIHSPDKIGEKLLFWRCVWIAFIVSSGLLWAIEHHSNLALQAKLEQIAKPQFDVVLDQLLDTHATGSDITVVMIQMGIMNKGSDSAVTNYRVHYHSNTLDQDVPVIWLPPSEERAAFPKEYQTIDGDVPNMLYRGQSPIIRGSIVAGKLFIRIPGNRQFELSHGATLAVTVQDYLGDEFTGNMPTSGKFATILPFHTACDYCPDPNEKK